MKFDSTDKIILDVASIMTVTGAMLDMLPAVAAVFTIVWTGIRIYETETVQKLFKRKTNGKEADASKEENEKPDA